MSSLNQLELQHMRHLIGSYDTATQKLQEYAQNTTDPQAKAFFQKSIQDAQTAKQKLTAFLN